MNLPDYWKKLMESIIVDPMARNKNSGNSNPYGAELLGNISAPMGAAGAVSGAVGETVILDKPQSEEDSKKCNDCIDFFRSSIRQIKNNKTVPNQPDISDSSTNITQSFNQAPMHDIFLGKFSESVASNIEEVREYIMDKNSYRVQEAFRIYESVYRDDKRVRFTPKQNLEFHKLVMERRNDVGELLTKQNNDIRVCTEYCERARAAKDFDTLGIVLENLREMEFARDKICDVYSALSFSRIQNDGPDKVSYLRESVLTVKLKTIKDLIRIKATDPASADLMKNKEWSVSYKKWCELQNQQDELIKEREKLYSINHKKPSKTLTDAIARINAKLASILKQISALDDKITDIETQLMKQNCMSKSYWKRRIDQCQTAIDSNEKRMADKEKHLKFVDEMLGNGQVQSNPDTAKAIALQKEALQLEIDILKKGIDKSKMLIVKWKGIAKNAPDKTSVRDGKITDVKTTTESATLGERLDKIVDNFVNKQLRADDDFRELDDRLWRENAELNSLNRKAARLTENDEDADDIAKKITAKEKEIKELHDKWEKRLEEIAPYLPYSYWEKLSNRYTKQIVWNTDMADSFADSAKDAKAALASIESGWVEGSAALMRSNIKFYQDRAEHYRHEAKALMRLQKDAEERMKNAPKKKGEK